MKARAQVGAWLIAAAAGLSSGVARAASIHIEGGAVVLGKTESMPMTLRVDEPPGADVRPLRIAVNVGSFSEPTRLGPGKYRVTYIPPSTRYPQLALVAVWRETGPDAQIDFLRFPLFGTTKIPVTTKRGAKIQARVGFETFGPFTADAKGGATIPVSVPPEVKSADLDITDLTGIVVKKTVPVAIPPYNRLTAALVPHAVVADGNSWVRLELLYALGGVGVPADQIHVRPSVGTATIQSALGGRYVYRYVPPQGTPAGTVTFDVTIDGDPVARATARLTLGLPPPARVVLRPPAVPLQAGSGETAPVSLLVMDLDGLGLADQRPDFTANGLPLQPLVYRGAGTYEATFKAPESYPPGGLVQFFGAVRGPSKTPIAATANYQLKAAPRPGALSARIVPSPIPVDGRTVARVQLDVRDLAGLPLTKAKLITVASDGTLGRLEERAPGVYEAEYTPPPSLPPSEATLRILDEEGFEQTVPLPLRHDPRRLLVGASAGWALSPGDAAGPRVGIDGWVPFRVRAANLAAGISVSMGRAERDVADATGTLVSRSTATFVPVTLQLALEPWSGRRLALSLGGGGVATVATFHNSLTGPGQVAAGFGAMGFVAGTWALGRGQLFLEASWTWAPVETAHFRLEAGGPKASLGYRIGVL